MPALGARRIAIVVTPLLVAAGLGLAGCSSTGDEPATAATGPIAGETVRMWISPDLAECVGVAPMMCMQVAYSEGGDTQLFYDTIEGFDFVEGTSYVVDVAVTDVENPPADASSLHYTLVDVVSTEP